MSVKGSPRILDAGAQAPAALRRIVGAGRADLPSADQLDRLARRLPFGVPPPGHDGGNPPHSPGPAGGSPGPSVPGPPAPGLPVPAPGLLLSAAAGAALGLATLGILGQVTGSPAGSSPAPIMTAGRSARRDTETAPPRAPADDRAVAQGARESPKPTGTSAAVPPDPKAPASAILAAPASAAVLDDAPRAPASPGPSTDAPVADAETEIQLLQRAQDALGSDPARALDLASRHAARFPSGSLSQEREVIAIDALVRLGRRDEARARAAAFAERLPSSAHRARIEALVAGEKMGDRDHNDRPAAPPTR